MKLVGSLDYSRLRVLQMRAIKVVLCIASVLFASTGVGAAPDYALESDQWHQLVIPGDSSSLSVRSVFADQLPVDQYNTLWAVFRWDNQVAEYVNPGLEGSLPMGQGFWIIQVTGEPVMLNAVNMPSARLSPSDACPSANGCVEVALFTATSIGSLGMIGSALATDQALDSLVVISPDTDGECAIGCDHATAVAAGVIENSIIRYNPIAENYENLDDVGLLKPWESAWFRRNKETSSGAVAYLFDGSTEPSSDPHHPPPDGGAANLESLRNTDPLFRQHEVLSSADLTGLGFFHDGFTEPAPQPDNGASPQGQFRIGCQYSHFGYNDPIVKPSQPNKSHLHMFWGNTKTNAFTSFNEQVPLGDPNDIMESGGSTCQGFELNRSAYWVPALLTNRHSPRSVVIPDVITIYYKSYRPQEVNPLPAGIEFLSGNVGPNAEMRESFTQSPSLYWSCGNSGIIRKVTNRIPTDCNADEYINATITFPQCLAVDSNGDPVLSSPDFMSHTRMIPNNDQCPSTHPYRVPQISYLLYYPNGTDGAGAGVANWVLSSDKSVPGGSLHGDWLGGWHDQAMQKWIDGCHDPKEIYSGPRNCSIGQTGRNGTNRQFRRVSRLNDYDGPNFLQLD